MRNFVRIVGFSVVVAFLFILISPGALLAQDYKYGFFPDVANDHWAKQVITKMNLRGVAGGIEENGKNYFKPDQDVTQLQAVLFASRTMGLKKKEDSIASGRYIPFFIPDWARNSVIVAIDEGLIDQNSFEADKGASRAWVAQILVKMINKEGELNEVANEVLPFIDSGAIPSEFVNYVKVANKYGLIAGNIDNTFAPNQPVTRAQMIAFLSRAEKYLEWSDSNLLIGNINQINGNNIGVVSGSQEYTVIRNISSNLYGPTGEIWITDLRVNDQVYLIVDGNIIRYLEVGNFQVQQTSQTKKITGEVIEVYSNESIIIIKTDEDSIETVNLSSNVQIYSDNSSTKLSIDQIKNQYVEIIFDSQGRATGISLVTGRNISNENEGIIFKINPDIELLTLKIGNNLTGYIYNESTKVTVGNNRFATVKDLEEGDKISINAVDGRISNINLIAKGMELNLEGTIRQISLENRIITLETTNKELKAYYIVPNLQVDFSGDVGLLLDISVGDIVRANIADGEITALSITNRKLYEKIAGVTVSNDSVNRLVTFRDKNNQLQVYEVEQGAKIYINAEKVHLHQIQKDMQVELELREGKVVSLVAKDTLLGTVAAINATTKVLDITLTTGESKTYTIDNSVRIRMEGFYNYGLTDIYRGDIVEVKIENNKVTEIKIRSTITYEITEVNRSSTVIKVVDVKNSSRSLSIHSGVDLDIHGKENPKVADLQENSIIKVTYMGYTIERVEMAPVIIGTVTSVDASEKVIYVGGHDGQNYSYEFNNNSTITKGGYTLQNLGTLATGDRVVVEENIKGGRVFGIMSKVSGTVGHVYNDKSKIYLKETQVTWKEYDMIPNAYIHNGQKELTPVEVKMDSSVDLFVVNDKVYEVLKK